MHRVGDKNKALHFARLLYFQLLLQICFKDIGIEKTFDYLNILAPARLHHVDDKNKPLLYAAVFCIFMELYYLLIKDFRIIRIQPLIVYIYQYKDHLGNVRVSYQNNGYNSPEVVDNNDYYPFGMSFIRNAEEEQAYFGTASFKNYKYNGKELQTETGMYDYGARFYMPDLGRWGVIDPRSQYTHEAYSYVWNNPITFADPTGMQGEKISDWITNRKGGYKWDPNVTGPENTPYGWKYIGPTGSYRIPGATVQLLEGGKKFTDIDEVAVSRVSPAVAMIVLSQNARLGVFAFLAVASWYVISDFVHTTPTQYGTRIDPMTHSPHTMNSESDSNSNDDKDVNGQDVPQEQKVDGNGKPTRNERMQQKKAKNGNQGNGGDNEYNQSAEHTSGDRGSTRQKHQNGQARKNRDQGGEKGDRNRRRYK